MRRVMSWDRIPIGNMRLRVLSAVTGLSLLALSGCGNGDNEATEPPPFTTVTATETVTATTVVTQTATPSVETSTAEPDPFSDSDPGSSASADDGPTVLQPGSAQDRDLGLNDVFNTSGDWAEQRLDVASVVDVRAVSTEVSSCNPDYGAGLEFRLANGFTKLSLSVGQANTSESSDQTMKIEVLGNDKQLDIRSVPFNSVVDLSIDVPNVNALKVVIYLEEKDGRCNGSVTAMLYKIQLS